MKEKLITIVVLPYAKAHILKMRLEALKIECELEDYHLIEGSSATTVRVKIFEKDIQEAIKELDLFLGLKEPTPKRKQEKRQILAAIDFTEISEKAARIAFNIAYHLKAEFVIMHSYLSPLSYAVPIGDFYPVNPTPLISPKEVEQTANKNFKSFISKLAQSIGKEKWDEVNPSYIVKPGYANDDIIAYAKEHHPRLIVLGRGGDKSWSESVGSVTADVMFSAPVPVLVIPEDVPDKRISDFKSILYATNFDAKDFSALDKLMGILRPFEMKLICAHIGQPDEYGWDLARLEGMKDILHKKYKEKEFECKLIMGNDVFKTLENYLENEDIDVLAITTHRRNIISRLFNPSLAKKMVFHTQTPILVFHA
jgi:nucleotide-binding universal stress UspA family protein